MFMRKFFAEFHYTVEEVFRTYKFRNIPDNFNYPSNYNFFSGYGYRYSVIGDFSFMSTLLILFLQ